MTKDEVRERLVELLGNHCDYAGMVAIHDDSYEVLADHLIAHGVTFAEDHFREPTKMMWIPVSERLPKDGEEVLCYTEEYNAGAHVRRFSKNLRCVDSIAFAGKSYERPGFYCFNDEYGWIEDKYVTHWMPLPEPPKEM